MITIITVGKKHESWVESGILTYQKRLLSPFDIKWVFVTNSTLDGSSARQKESGAIFTKLKPSDYVILLDERGELMTSPELSALIERKMTTGFNVVIIVGGAYGVNDDLRERAQLVWSLSPLVFPHQLVRLMLIEQIYRAQEIARGGKYHHV